MFKYESTLVKYMLRYGLLTLADMPDEEGNTITITVADYVHSELERDNMQICNPVLAAIYDGVLRLQAEDWPRVETECHLRLQQEREAFIAAGEAEIRSTAADLSDIERRENELKAVADEKYLRGMRECAMTYPERVLCSSPDDDVRKQSMELVAERHVLSKVFTKYTHIVTDDERLPDIVPRAVVEYKDAMLEWQIQQLNRELKEASAGDADEQHYMQLMARLSELHALRRDMATYLGERIILPR